MAEFTKKSFFEIDQLKKPIKYLDDGRAIVTVIASSDAVDTDDEVVDIDSFKGEKTMVVSAYHNQCGGTPVNTGAKIIRKYTETVFDNDKPVKLMLFEIEVKPTDEIRYCDYGSLERKSNGNLLEEIEKGILAFVSMGFKVGQRIRKEGYTLLKNCIGIEISFLDVRPANIYANVLKTMNKRTKCFCGNAKPGRLVTDIATATEIYKLKTQISEDKWIALKGEEEIEVNAEEYELVRTPDEAKAHFMEELKSSEKACSCQNKKKDELLDKSQEGEEVNDNTSSEGTGEVEEVVEEDLDIEGESTDNSALETQQQIEDLKATIEDLNAKLLKIEEKATDFESRAIKSLTYLNNKISTTNEEVQKALKPATKEIIIPSILK